MSRCDVIMGVVIINFSFKWAQMVILWVCKVSLRFHISFLSYRGGHFVLPPPPPGIQTPKKPRGNRVKHKLFLFVSITSYKFLNNLILSGHIFVFQCIVIMIKLYWLLTIKKNLERIFRIGNVFSFL